MSWQKEVDDTQEKIDKGLPLYDKLFQLYQQRDPTFGPQPAARADPRIHEQAKAKWTELETERKGQFSEQNGQVPVRNKEKDKIWMNVHKQYWSDDGVPRMLETDPQYDYATDLRNPMEERLLFLERNRPSVWLRRIPLLKKAILEEMEFRRVRKSKLTKLVAEWYTLVLEALILHRDLLEQSLIHQQVVPVFDMEPSTCQEFGKETAQKLITSPMIRYGLVELLMDAIEQKYKNAVSAAKRRVTYFQNKINEGDSSTETRRQLDKAKVQLAAVQDELTDLESKQQRSAAVQLEATDLEEIARKAWEVTKLYKGSMDKNKVYDEAFARLRKKRQQELTPPARPISEAIQELNAEIREIESQIKPMIQQMAKPEAGRRGLIAASSSNTRPVKLWEETARLYAKLLDLEYIRDEKKKRQADGRMEDISIRAPPPNDERKAKWKARREEDLDTEMQLLVMQTNDSRAEAERNLAVDLSHTENSLRRKGLSPYRKEALTRRKEHLEKKQERLASINRDIEDLSMNDNKSQQAEQELEELRSMRDSLMKDLAPSWPSVSEDDVVDKFRQKIRKESQNESEPDMYSEEIEELCEEYARTNEVGFLMRAIAKQKELVAKTGEAKSLYAIIEDVLFYLPSYLHEQARKDIDTEHASHVSNAEERRFYDIIAKNKQSLQRMQEAKQQLKKPDVIDLVSDSSSDDTAEESKEEEEEEEPEEEEDKDAINEESEEDKKTVSEESEEDKKTVSEESEEDMDTISEEEESEDKTVSEEEPRRSARIQAGGIGWDTDRHNTADTQEVIRRERQRARELASEVDNADQLRADLESDADNEESDEEEKEESDEEEEKEESDEEEESGEEEEDEEEESDEEEEKVEIPTREVAPNERVETIPVRTPTMTPRAIITNGVQCPRNSMSKAYLGGFKGRQGSLTRPKYSSNTWESWVTGDDIELVDREMPVFTLSQLMSAINICLVSTTSSVRMLEYLFCRARLCNPTMGISGKRLGIAGEYNLVNKLAQASLGIKTLTSRHQYDDLETKYAPQRTVPTPACFTRFVAYDSEAPEFSLEEEIHLNMISKIEFIISGSYNAAIMNNVINQVLEKYSEVDRKRFKALLP